MHVAFNLAAQQDITAEIDMALLLPAVTLDHFPE